MLIAGDPRRVQVQVVDLGYAPGGMNDEVRGDLDLLLAGVRMDDEFVAAFLDGSDRRAHLHVDAEVSGALDELGDEVRVEPLERSFAAVE